MAGLPHKESQKRDIKLPLKELFFSFLFHLFIVAVVFTAAAYIPEESQTMVVFLTPESGGGQAGSEGLQGHAPAIRKAVSKGRDQQKSSRTGQRDHGASKNIPRSQAENTPEDRKTTVVAEGDVADARATLGAGTVAESGDPGIGGGTPGGGSGSGSGNGSGDGRGSGSATGSRRGHGEGYGEGNAKERYVREHFAYIRDLILKRLSYPPHAKKFGWMGSLTVSFVVRENGIAEQIRVVKSSGYDILDQNVIRTIKGVQPFPRPPVKAELVIPVIYRLN